MKNDEGRLDLNLRDLGNGLAVLTIDHELLGPLVRAKATELPGYIRRNKAFSCAACGVGARQEVLAIGPENPPARRLTTRCPRCKSVQPAQDQTLAVVAPTGYFTAGGLAELRDGYEALIEQDAAARANDKTWFDGHPDRQARARAPMTDEERQLSMFAEACVMAGLVEGPVVVIVARDAPPHIHATPAPLPQYLAQRVHDTTPAELRQDLDLAEDALLVETMEVAAMGADAANVTEDELVRRASERLAARAKTAEYVRRAAGGAA